MSLKLYRIEIPEAKYSDSIWSNDPDQALKESLKIAFDRRGLLVINYDDREFISATPFVQYLRKKKRINLVCKERKSNIT